MIASISMFDRSVHVGSHSESSSHAQKDVGVSTGHPQLLLVCHQCTLDRHYAGAHAQPG